VSFWKHKQQSKDKAETGKAKNISIFFFGTMCIANHVKKQGYNVRFCEKEYKALQNKLIKSGI